MCEPFKKVDLNTHVDTCRTVVGRGSQGGKLGLRNEGTHMCRLAYQGHADEMEHLLRYGANANAADYDMRTALHIASAEGHLGVVQVHRSVEDFLLFFCLWSVFTLHCRPNNKCEMLACVWLRGEFGPIRI